MKIIDTILEGVKVIEPTILKDERGEFSRIFCDNELKEIVGKKKIIQINRSKTRKICAIRGMH